MPANSYEYNRVYNKQWYKDNRENTLKRVRARQAEMVEWYRNYKSTLKCNRCSENHPACLDFHHRDPKEKEFSISTMANSGYTKERILQEIAKCEILCSNCHKKEHYTGLV